jgi:membrane protein implicated in regulation of membrane protease activity
MFHSFQMPRHPLARLAAAVIGAVVLVAVLALGMFAFAALVVVGAVWLLVRSFVPANASPPRTNNAPPPGVIEGEFTVVEDARRESGAPHN